VKFVNDFKGLAIILYLVIILFTVFGEGCKSNESNVESPEDVDIDTVALTRSWEKAIPNQAVPEGLETIRASECGECHIEIYNEWRQSIHSVALQDPQFQAEWKKDNVYVCLN
jgi:hypothetical protein